MVPPRMTTSQDVADCGDGVAQAASRAATQPVEGSGSSHHGAIRQNPEKRIPPLSLARSSSNEGGDSPCRRRGSGMGKIGVRLKRKE
jgi:hypothetical protein